MNRETEAQRREFAGQHKKAKVIPPGDPEGFVERVGEIVDEAINTALAKYEFAELESILTQFKEALNDLNKRMEAVESLTVDRPYEGD